MTVVLYAVIYVCAAVFALVCLLQARRYAKAPLHLRWELYPVPHEARQRAAHGGSYFEQVNWWTRPVESNRLGELAAMLAEMVFLKGVWEHNRKLWYRSFSFHFGLYLLGATVVLLALSAVPGTPGVALHYLYKLTGVAGAVLAMAGAAGLLARRLTDREVKPYTTPADLVHLGAFLFVFGVLAAAYLSRPAGAPSLRSITAGILTFDTAVRIPGLLAAGLALAALLAAYIPMTQMSHFIGKYFTYHSVRWDDRPSRNNAGIAKQEAECLGYRPTWSAPHVGADGVKTWVDIATANPAQQGKK